MPTTKRRFEPSVIQRLFDAPYRFQFFQAVRMIELWLKRNGVPHERALTDYLRFTNRISLGFPASEIEALNTYPQTIDKTEQGLLKALQRGDLKYISLTPTFMGFLGGNGALPSHYSERIAAHQAYERDEGPRAFLDTFSNRSLALFYEAWRKYRLELHYEASGKDRFLPLLLSLSGLGHGSLRGRLSKNGDGVLDESIGYFAAALRQHPVSAAYMQRVLSEYFAVPMSIEQFVGCWYDVPREHQTMLGSNNATLGTAAMVGERVWQRDLRVRLRIGPLWREDFEQFLPGAKAANALKKMLTMFTSVCLEYEVQLVLRSSEVEGASLATERDGGRLGWDTFLTTKPEVNDRTDVCYQIHALSH
ncbi:MAG: type VI secretion system baseplate subunit TssG [Glaciimonas sp.]|nr:type VI secretion system baseplate subunit TssG [Glaciimonas sp.]